MTTNTNPTRRPRLGRSPAYPAIDLEQAIERVKEVRLSLGTHPAHVDAVIEVWGLSPRASIARQTIASLRYFGLMVFEGRSQNRTGHVSQLALDILLTEDGSPEKHDAIKTSALTPPVYKAIWEEYGGDIPNSDRQLGLGLIRNRGFNDNAVGTFIRQFRKTLDFAGLTSAETEPIDDQGLDEPKVDMHPPAPVVHEKADSIETLVHESESHMRSISLPVSSGDWPTLQVPYPMSERTWAEMIAVLTVMKPGIVVNQQQSGPHSESTNMDEITKG